MVEKAGDAIDVVRIMKEIRESIQRKREQGVYTEEEIEDLARVRLRSYAEEAFIDSKLLDRLLAPSHDWNISGDYLIRSHRKGVAVALLLAAKKIVRPFVRLYTDHIVNRQAQLNLYFAYLLRNSIREITRLQIEVTALRSRVAALEEKRSAREGQDKRE
jgi:hypothetical protein